MCFVSLVFANKIDLLTNICKNVLTSVKTLLSNLKAVITTNEYRGGANSLVDNCSLLGLKNALFFVKV